MRDEVFLIGRIVFSLMFLLYGVRHLTQTEGSAGYAAYKKVPSAKNMVLFTGAAMIAGGLAIIFGVWMDLAAVGIAIFVMAAALFMHRFWEETDDQARQAEMAQFMKNVSVAGAALILASVSKYAPYTITDGVF
ncbi:MAG TPA: DoxX family protein [Ilumatobacteraceae bacterium]|nr:DoxX family protein [Ilumatobacteraceae bacterium]